MTVSQFASEKGLKILSLPKPEREIEGGYIGDLLSWVMSKAESGNAWITIMSNANICAVATLTDVSCIILAESVELDENVRNLSEEKGINVLSSEKSAFDIAAMVASVL